MNKAYIFKLNARPYTLEHACRVRYYIKVCSQDAILRAAEDLNISLSRVLYNCEHILQQPALDYEQYTDYRELEEISVLLREPIHNFIAGACIHMAGDVVLNISTAIINHDQLLLSHEVYKQ